VLQPAFFPALRRFEADLARLASELEGFHDTARPAAAAPLPGTPAKPPPAAGPAVAAPPARVDSLIIGEFPLLFDEFRAKGFNLLWRGSRDCFSAWEFHRRGSGRANTLTGTFSASSRHEVGVAHYTPVQKDYLG
jgi:hypothetical protein